MSILTKILIVLLTVCAFILCAFVVQYVSVADDWKAKYNDKAKELRSCKNNLDKLQTDLEEKGESHDRQVAGKNKEISSLKTEKSKLSNKIKVLERKKAELEEKVNGWVSVTKGFSKTTELQTRQLEATSEELKGVKEDRIKLEKENNDLSGELREKMALIASLEDDVKIMREQKAGLEGKINKFVLKYGKVSTRAKAVTKRKDRARPVRETREIALKCLVDQVDMKNSMATINIGKADGVKEGMKFHVTRGDEFICDIVVIEVDADKSFGFLDLIQEGQRPKHGDNASTNF